LGFSVLICESGQCRSVGLNLKPLFGKEQRIVLSKEKDKVEKEEQKVP
jgi:hypothetical protein